MANPLVERLRERSYHALLERGLKLTRPRIAVLDFLLARPETQLQAEQIFNRLNDKTPGLISRSTVYRTLDVLVQADIVHCTIINANKYCYQLCESERDRCHYHLVDVTDGSSVSFNADAELRRVLQRICRERGFSEQYHVLKVYGEFKRNRRKRGPSATGSDGDVEIVTPVAAAEQKV
ncbi:MAG: transcriptional repressor [bacterium]|nr:transcriptional repressor [bacterium]